MASGDSGDTWSQLQAHKRKQDNLLDRLKKRRKERQAVVDITGVGVVKEEQPSTNDSIDIKPNIVKLEQNVKKEFREEASPKKEVIPLTPTPERKHGVDTRLERIIVQLFSDSAVNLPSSLPDFSDIVEKKICTNAKVKEASVVTILEKLGAQDILSMKRIKDVLTILECDHSKLIAVYGPNEDNDEKLETNTESKRKHLDSEGFSSPSRKREKKTIESHDLASLLSMPTTKESENKKIGEEILDLLNQPSAKEQSLMEKFKSQGGAMVKEFCQYGTQDECNKYHERGRKCPKVHFKKIIQSHTDESLGDCSFLNTCFHMDTCKYVHYKVDTQNQPERNEETKVVKKSDLTGANPITLTPPQWVRCDVRYIDFEVLGKFSVVMADPPWDIHMELPYGTMADHEMKSMPVQALQDDGYIFLWVTGRAIELGRECLEIWGYKRIDELIWVKTNQLQRLIRTGRTGHWINHGKEHCLVGVKGRPDDKDFNRGLDCDVLVSEVRDTSHKPDEVYGLIERLAPGQRKIELFGRQHNVQPNWVTLGNQLNGVNLVDPAVVIKFQEKYPDGHCFKPKPQTQPAVIELTKSSAEADDKQS